MEQWNQIKGWDNDEDFRAFLVGDLQLPNADAILRRITIDTASGGMIKFAKGTRRLRYAAGNFYLETLAEAVDVGTGKHIDTKALQERFQRLVPSAVVTVKLDKAIPMGIAVKEGDVGDTYHYDIRFNPGRLRGPKRVAEKVAQVERILKA